MYQARTPDNGSIFLQFSVYLNRSYSSFSFFFFFVVFSFFALSHFLFFYFYFYVFSLSSSFPFLVFVLLPIYAQVPAERKKSWVPADGPMAVKYKESKLGPRPLREFPGNYHGKYASSSVGRELNKYTHITTDAIESISDSRQGNIYGAKLEHKGCLRSRLVKWRCITLVLIGRALSFSNWKNSINSKIICFLMQRSFLMTPRITRFGYSSRKPKCK